jgi:hypothetical protein
MMMMVAAADANLPELSAEADQQSNTSSDLPQHTEGFNGDAVVHSNGLDETPQPVVQTVEACSSLPPIPPVDASSQVVLTHQSSPAIVKQLKQPKSTETQTPPPLTAEETVALRRKQKLQALWWDRLLRVFRWMVLIALGYGIYWLAQQPFWLVTPQQVHFKGTNILSNATVLPAIEKELNRPLYALQPQSIENELKKRFPLIASVQIRRRLFPVGLDVQVNEHQPWALIYEPEEEKAVLSYYRQVFLPLHLTKPLQGSTTATENLKQPISNQSMPKPYAFVLETHQSMRFNGEHFTLTPAVLSPESLLIFTSTQWFRQMPQAKRRQFLKDVDRLLNGVKAVDSVAVDAVIYRPQQDALSLVLRLKTQPNQPITALLGGWNSGLFDRALRLKPLVAGLPFVKEAVGNEKAGNCYKQFDFRWAQNVAVGLCDPSLLEQQPTLEENEQPLVVLEDETTGNLQAPPADDLGSNTTQQPNKQPSNR